ncbi:ubiquinol-cytochrome c reductase iron-sulfur subunit [Microcystis protocystis FBCC-A270]|uniref:ubiquinol-cytochrome c reductase iron-sulfur subunit n=1 Tax=Microcystis protocystis TaxID=629747 RepID=UPI003D28D11B
MNRREFVALVSVGGAMACAPEILGTATDQEMTPAQAADGFVKVTGITLKELEAKGSFLDKKSPVGSLLLIWEKKTKKISAVNPTCTHEGCTVKWNTGAQILACPCHPGKFTATGVVTNKPPKGNLTTYQVKVEKDVIFVKKA